MREIVRRCIMGGVAVAACALLVAMLLVSGRHTPISDPDDFRAFYCAGQTALHGADPYRTEPLRTCEHAAAGFFDLHFPKIIVYLAPLPPSSLAFFAAFGALPFGAASALWFLTSLAALGIATIATSRLSSLSPAPIALTMLGAGAYVSIDEGQLGPLLVASIALAALAARSQRASRVVVPLALAMLEPHVAIWSLLAACFERRFRIAIALLVTCGLLIDLAAGGPARTIEYLTQVVPAHASGEIKSTIQQFSLTTLLWSFGVSQALAARIGTLDYLAMAILGTWVALRLRVRYDDPAFLILVPPAFVLLGGSYIHLFQMVVALPLCFVCFAAMPKRRLAVAVATMCLAFPFQQYVRQTSLFDTFYAPVRYAQSAPTTQRYGPPDLAENTYLAFRNDDRWLRPTPREATSAMLPKIPTWVGLALLVAVCLLEAFTGHSTRRATVATYATTG